MSDEENINNNNEKSAFNNPSNNHYFCNLAEFEKVKYFTGQLLLPEDFEQEQNYINNKRHLINKLVNGSGVVCGLDIDWLNPDKTNDRVPIIQLRDNEYKITIRIKMEFDKKSYCNNEKVRIELWDQDNTVKSEQGIEESDDKDNAVKSNIYFVKINISSVKDKKGIDISLKKFKGKDVSYDDNIYKGEIFLIKNGESSGNQLLV